MPRRKYLGAYQALFSQLDPTRATLQDFMLNPFLRRQYGPFGNVHVGWYRLEDAVDRQATDKACQGCMSKIPRIRQRFGVCSTPEGQLGVSLEGENKYNIKMKGMYAYDGNSVLADIDRLIVGVTEWRRGGWRGRLTGTDLHIEAGTDIVGGGRGHGLFREGKKGKNNDVRFLSVAPLHSVGPIPNNQSNPI